MLLLNCSRFLDLNSLVIIIRWYGTAAIALRSRIPTLLETKMFIAWQHNEHHESLSRFFRPGYVFFQLHPCFHAIILSINDIKQKTNERTKMEKYVSKRSHKEASQA